MKHYEIEFKIEGLAVCKPDTPLTNEMKYFETDTKERSFSILVMSDEENPDEAILITRLKLEMYLDLYNLFFEHAMKISDEGNPFGVSTVEDDKIVSESYAVSLKIGPLFIMDEKMKDQSINILKLLSEPRNGYLRVAADYNRRASLENNAENELIHLFIALEALYSLENEKQEIQFRFSNRISTFLGKDKEDRLSLRKRAKKLYNLRSQIVHGSHKFDAENIEDVIQWVRESILRFLLLVDKFPDYTHDDIIERIDDAIIDNSVRDELRKESEDLVKRIEENKIKAKEKIEQRSNTNSDHVEISDTK